MSESVLSTADLNRALLARQLLLKRSKISPAQAVERIGGLQTQYAPSAYIGLWSRLEGFKRDSLTRALEQRKIVQATLMRVTIHMVSAADYQVLTEGVRKGRREWWKKVGHHEADEIDMNAVASLLKRHLRKGPLRQSELTKIIDEAGWPRIAWSGAGLWVDLVRVPPSGTWEHRRADLYGLAQEWLKPARATEAEGLELLVRRYLGGFGPAPIRDLANWAGLPVTKFKPLIERMKLRRFSDEAGAELLDLPRAPLPDPDTPAPVRFLPTWDATLLVHARRTQILPEEYRPLVFDTKTPHSVPTFLVDGQVAGKWRYETGRIQLDPFGKIPRPVRRELEEEADRLASFHWD